MTSIAVIGGGKIGEALVGGLVAAGTDPAQIVVTNRSPERSEELRERYGVETTADNAQAASGAETIFLCVKPTMIGGVLREIAETINDNDADTTVVSMAAGLSLAALQEDLSAGTAVVRVMPNTPMMVGKGVCAVTPGRFVGAEQLEGVKELLRAVGTVVEVAEEEMDAVTALAGSSPAYVYLVAEALIDAGVSLGLTREVATRLASGAIEGAGAMLAQEGADPTTLRANVSSPAGTTVAALRELEESGLRGAFFRAAEACALRSKELGAPVGSGED
ncbi:pyrroline-5-carboxylate reductase [Corynebacterium sp. zg-331]|uniref:pyrroline-5-carboxylate reductase n=1 Tax=unclassified Corynebacterium TaxID=2624378 RepID=UPI00128BC866|nr:MULTISPECIES: pyrroline-5-carboxylate reductase [unclassified Corynebacterium]MBC3186709.1 pyrroline-5-carboxylate reductase [Corynebacterium sp. zg-331]MPV53191.1 pyrroline-5-carboxylate reductase [Corynebacterium sp. zg331]